MTVADLAAHEQRVTRVCFHRAPDPDDLATLAGTAERWLTYRNMVRSRFERVLRAAFPRTVAGLGEAFEPAFASWLHDAPPAERLFRDVPLEFHAHVASQLADVAAWLPDMARYEETIWRVLGIDDRNVPAVTEISFERPPVMNPAVALLDVSYHVHGKRKKTTPPPPETGLWHLCVYRDRQHRAATVVLNGLARDLVASWIDADVSLTESVQRVAAARGDGIGPKFLESLGAMLADYLERGLLLGSRAG